MPRKHNIIKIIEPKFDSYGVLFTYSEPNVLFFKTETKTLELYLGQKFRNWGEKTIEEELEWIYNPDREGFWETDFNKELERIFGN